jgi:hypothetical protein
MPAALRQSRASIWSLTVNKTFDPTFAPRRRFVRVASAWIGGNLLGSLAWAQKKPLPEKEVLKFGCI